MDEGYKPSPAEAALIARLERVVGYVPVGTGDLLHVLSHPDVLPFTDAYLDERREW